MRPWNKPAPRRWLARASPRPKPRRRTPSRARTPHRLVSPNRPAYTKNTPARPLTRREQTHTRRPARRTRHLTHRARPRGARPKHVPVANKPLSLTAGNGAACSPASPVVEPARPSPPPIAPSNARRSRALGLGVAKQTSEPSVYAKLTQVGRHTPTALAPPQRVAYRRART